MINNFSQYFNNENNLLFNEYADTYITCLNSYESEEYTTILSFYKKIINLLISPFTIDELISLFEDFAQYNMSIPIPYVIITNEIYGLQNLLMSKITDANADIVQLIEIFKLINNKVAKVYLYEYINKLVSLNNVRLNSLTDLVEKNIITHYESHLIWLTKLANIIRDEKKDTNLELNHALCTFGVWMENDAKNIIQNNSKYKTIYNLHHDLHFFAQKIFLQLNTNEYHILITYLEKCEFISLSIGTELALIDNILMNKKITKDTLTGALNRQALRNIFENQYELSFATNSAFVLAMCDLDFFKTINDTYGHIAGDNLLKLFVEIVKKHIRTSDIIIRYGGEEFIIMLPAINKEKGAKVLENIRQEFQDSRMLFKDSEISATVSIGMIEIKPEKEFNTGLINQYIMIADQELYRAKESGRNKIEIY
jgi:diguanylate cyclase